VTEPGLRRSSGSSSRRGVKIFKYYEPWTSEPEFGHGEWIAERCCTKNIALSATDSAGKGDGPAASGLEPKPAIHANIPFEKVPTDYLYNVIYYGGRAMGKSPTMPYWGLTIGQQGVADVMAYLKVTFKGGAEVAQAAGTGEGPERRVSATQENGEGAG
jgi:hypothetical protein